MNKTAVIFPGQGAQVVGMGRDVAADFPAAAEVFRRADELLGWKLSALCFDGPAERLHDTDASQPAIFVASVAIWKALRQAAPRELAPSAMAGLSLGEYTALHLAGWIGFEDALRLVAERGRLMQAAAEAHPGGMVSIMGLDEQKVLALCRAASVEEVLAPANFNCPGQVVISGAVAACQRAVREVERFGGRAVPLTVAGAFHSPLMGPAVAGLRKALADVRIEKGPLPVVSNVTADYYSSPEEVRGRLEAQVAEPTRWQASVERLIADGFDCFAEVGPGRVLTGLMRKINRAVSAVNYSTAESLRPMAVGS